jgi:hypothetical protein
MISRRVRIIFLALFVITDMLMILYWFRRLSEAKLSKGPPPSSVASHSAEHAKPLLGESILAHYADPSRAPEEDLTWMSRALGNFALLVKGDNPIPLGANEDIANALRGKNRAQFRFLPDQHPAFNAQGQIVDRWGTPLYFHAVSRDRLDIRSAGPDRIMWTADDVHRRHDGRFLHGEALLAPSLLDAGVTKE